MHVNHAFLLDFCERQKRSHSPGSFKALDYGCGKGETVSAGRARGLEFFGAEAFYEGGDRREAARQGGLLGTAIREIRDGRLDFADEYFDVVVSNQVLEHVPDLPAVLAEIQRVLKPGGVSLHLFPSRDIWREGHCGIPFIHWFSKTSRLRRPYMLALRRLGMGKFKTNKPPERFVDGFLPWLDQFTFYRKRVEILSTFRQYFVTSLVEEEVIAYRLQASGRGAFVPLVRFALFQPLAKEAFRKLAGLAVLAKKNNSHR